MQNQPIFFNGPFNIKHERYKPIHYLPNKPESKIPKPKVRWDSTITPSKCFLPFSELPPIANLPKKTK